MIITQKCNCCIHEEICSKMKKYDIACRQILQNVPNDIKDTLSVSVSCKHFQPKSATVDEMVGDADDS